MAVGAGRILLRGFGVLPMHVLGDSTPSRSLRCDYVHEFDLGAFTELSRRHVRNAGNERGLGAVLVWRIAFSEFSITPTPMSWKLGFSFFLFGLVNNGQCQLDYRFMPSSNDSVASSLCYHPVRCARPRSLFDTQGSHRVLQHHTVVHSQSCLAVPLERHHSISPEDCRMLCPECLGYDCER